MMRFCLPVLTLILGISVLFITESPTLAVIAAVLPNSFVLGYFFDKMGAGEKKSKEQNF